MTHWTTFVISKLIVTVPAYRIDSKVSFILNSFENLNHVGDPVKLAYERLKSLNSQSPSLDDCLFEVYQIFIKAATAGKLILSY